MCAKCGEQVLGGGWQGLGWIMDQWITRVLCVLRGLSG